MDVLTNINRNNFYNKKEFLSEENDQFTKGKNRLSLSDFNFLTVQELLKDCNNSLTDDLIEERRSK